MLSNHFIPTRISKGIQRSSKIIPYLQNLSSTSWWWWKMMVWQTIDRQAHTSQDSLQNPNRIPPELTTAPRLRLHFKTGQSETEGKMPGIIYEWKQSYNVPLSKLKRTGRDLGRKNKEKNDGMNLINFNIPSQVIRKERVSEWWCWKSNKEEGASSGSSVNLRLLFN